MTNTLGRIPQTADEAGNTTNISIMPGLRERKKAQTRAAIQRQALRLFAEKGYEATTVEEIAAAAGVSHMTFFRYFPSKEDVVLMDDYDPLLVSLISARPAGEPTIEKIRHACKEGLTRIYAADRRHAACRRFGSSLHPDRVGALLSVGSARARQRRGWRRRATPGRVSYLLVMLTVLAGVAGTLTLVWWRYADQT